MIDRLLEFLAEDLRKGDITTEGVISPNIRVEAEIVVKQDGTLAGLEEVDTLLNHFGLEHQVFTKDGGTIKKGETIITITGAAKRILELERVVLNILSRMSGIASRTNTFASKCSPYGVKVMATRKTTPGFRSFEKKAVGIGGGLQHRQGLYDEVLIKDNHLVLVGIEEAVKKARLNNPKANIEIEVSSLKDAVEAIKSGADIILLDNLSPQESNGVIDRLREQGLRDRVTIELSGGINIENVVDYAKVGADRISLGTLTTGAEWLDIHMMIEPLKNKKRD